MKYFLTLLAILGIGLTYSASASSSDWHTDFVAASERSQKEDKPILLLFTGSTWCPPCKALEKNIFSKSAFKDYASNSLILVEADFGRDGTPRDENYRDQHVQLMKRFGIRGFPTVVLLNPNGQLVDRTGFRPGTSAEYVEHLKDLLGDSEG